MSQGLPQAKPTTSRMPHSSSQGTFGAGARLLQNYPQEPIGSRPSYVGELVATLRDGTPEIRGLLETECDLRFNCKVCGSILPSTRSFVIHKRQFCTTKYLEYQRRNVAIMERISNVVSYETRGLQTGDDMLDLDSPINASLLIPLPMPLPISSQSSLQPPNGTRSSSPRQNGGGVGSGVGGVVMDDRDGGSPRPRHQPTEDIPDGVEFVQPSRPPADGVYRFGMGGMSLVASKKKKNRVHASGTVKKKRKPGHVLYESVSSSGTKKLSTSHAVTKKSSTEPPFRPPIRDGPIMIVTKPHPPKIPVVAMILTPKVEPASKPAAPVPPPVTAAAAALPPKPVVKDAENSAEPTFKRSRRCGPPINGFDMDRKTTPAKSTPPADGEPAAGGQIRRDPKPSAGTGAVAADQSLRDVKDPAFVRALLDQMYDVADYPGKKCRECNRNVVSIYNLDRHVATQHLGLKESEYSLISKELRRLRAEVFGPLKSDGSDGGGGPADSSMNDSQTAEDDGSASFNAACEQMDASHSRESSVNGTVQETEEEPGEEDDEHGEVADGGANGHAEDVIVKPPPSAPTTSKTALSDSESITERLSAMIRNPDTLKEILTTKEKPDPPIDYELHQLVEIQRQISDAADSYLQCCRICNKQYFDIYVLNRHIMTVHLRLPERSCGTINRMIKDNMKRHPHAFDGMAPIADSLAD